MDTEVIRLVPDEGRLRIEVRGELGALLRLADGARSDGEAGKSATVPFLFMEQIKMDAGTGFEPVTFRL